MAAISEARDQLQGALMAAGNTPRKRNTDSSDEDNLIDIQDVALPVRIVKRRRKRSPPAAALRDSYVMKLFDRSVNLARFGPDWPLYPVCRAWMANDPHNQAPLPPPKKEPVEEAEGGDSSTEPGFVFAVPRPEPAPPDPATGCAADLRLPNIRPPDATRLAPLQPSKADDAPSKTELLAAHLIHWRSVREDWRRAARNNEKRYAHSFSTLASICVPDN